MNNVGVVDSQRKGLNADLQMNQCLIVASIRTSSSRLVCVYSTAA